MDYEGFGVFAEEKSETYFYQICHEAIVGNATRGESYDVLISEVADRIRADEKIDTEFMDMTKVIPPYFNRALDEERCDFRRKIELDVIDAVKKSYAATGCDFLAFFAGMEALEKMDVSTGLLRDDFFDIVEKIVAMVTHR